MKSTLVYVGLFVASLLIATEVVLLVVPQNKGQVSGPPGKDVSGSLPDSSKAKVDSTAPTHANLASGNAGARHDTVKSASAPSRDTLKSDVTTRSPGLRDSLELLRMQLVAEQKKVGVLNSKIAADTARADSASAKEKKTVAKLLEAMDAQGAAKILHGLDDKEVKELLFTVKKRQAGKILGSLDPERAARIIK